MKWLEVPIGNICELVNGRAFKPSDWTIEGLPIVRIQNLNDPKATFNRYQGEVRQRFLINSGELLFSWSGTPGTSFGAFFWDRGPAVLNQHIFRVVVSKKVDPNYMRHALNGRLNRIVAQAHGGVGLQHITKSKLEATTLPLPPLPEQRRIADILDRADALRSMRRAALAELDDLVQAVFVEMFGDPVTNPKGWPRIPFGTLLAGIESGWSPTCLDRPAGEREWGVLKLGAVTWCEYDPTESKALPPNVEPKPELEVRPGDLLFARKNTYELVAACALVRNTPPRLMMSDLIFRLRLTSTAAIEPHYLHQLLIYPTKRRAIQKLAGGSAGSMPNISKGRLVTVGIELPPLPLQQKFAQRVGAIESLKSAHRASLAELDSLFASLQHRAFRGELS